MPQPDPATFPTTTIVGSTKHIDAITEHAQRLTLAGHVVLAPCIVTSEQVTKTAPTTKAMLTALHLRKIDMADAVLVVNVDGYMGESTSAEVRYARSFDKPVEYVEHCGECGPTQPKGNCGECIPF